MTDLTELGKRLVQCKTWRWMAGMRTIQGHRLLNGLEPNTILTHARDQGDFFESLVPDLSDAATKGCVLQLIREAWNDLEAHFTLGAAGWVLMSGESRVANMVYPSPPSKDEAKGMVNAMEAAP